MAKIEESEVFEYYVNVFKKLEEQDGAYYPSKHDPVALSDTASNGKIAGIFILKTLSYRKIGLEIILISLLDIEVLAITFFRIAAEPESNVGKFAIEIAVKYIFNVLIIKLGNYGIGYLRVFGNAITVDKHIRKFVS